jgi:ankyrin repeat protein
MRQQSLARQALHQDRLLLILCLLIVAAFGSTAIAQTSTPPPPDATEVFAPQVVGPPPGYQPKPGDYGVTALMIAVLNGDSSQVRNLIEAGVNVDATDDSGTTALIGAVGYGYNDIAHQLLKAGANPNVVSKNGDHALGIAVRYKETDIAIALLDHDANPNGYVNQRRREPHSKILSIAAVTGQSEVVDALVRHSVDLVTDGPAALNVALWKGYEDISAALIAGGVDVNAVLFDPEKVEYPQTGETVLQTAAQSGQLNSVTRLLNRGALVDTPNRRGETALDYALRGEHWPVARLLIARGAAVSTESLLIALRGNYQEISRELIGSLNLATLSLEQFNSLILAADWSGEETVVDILLDGRSLVEPEKRSPRLIFARAATDNCEVTLWDLHENAEHILLSEKESCKSQFFVNDEANLLFAVSESDIQVVSLQDHSVTDIIPVPIKQIEEQTTSLEARQGKSFASNANGTLRQVSARVGEVGILTSGELTLATYFPSSVDGTFAHAYAYNGNTWRMIDEQYCERSDICPFQQILGRHLNSRPSDHAIWHPNIRQNPYFVSKINRPMSASDHEVGGGAVVLNIEGQKSEIQYSISDSEYCTQSCVFTNGITLKVPDREIMEIANYSGNSAIVDRYALLWTQPRGHSELLDLANGTSVFGRLQLAGWIH